MGGELSVLTCMCDRTFSSIDERTAWKLLQDHVAEFAQMDDTLHGLQGMGLSPAPSMPDLTLDEVIATHAADLERQWRLGMEDDPNVEPFDVWADHVVEYLALMVHRQHQSQKFEDCRNASCVWAKVVIGHARGSK